MKKINIQLTPINAVYSSGANSFITFSEDIYSSWTQRGILIKGYNTSYFKMKKRTAMPYIEFPIFSAKTGDFIKFDFKYKVSANSSLYIQIYEYDKNHTSIKQKDIEVKLLKLNNWYEHSLNIPIIKTSSESIGFLLNIRLVSGDEVELKDINMTLNTSNYNVNYNKEIIILDNKELFDYASRITLLNKINGDDYSAGLALINNYRTLNEDGSITFKSDDANFKYKGIVFRLSKMIKRSCGIYIKYSSNTVNTCGFRATNPVTGERYSGKVDLPNTNGEIKEVILRGTNPADVMLPPKDVVVEISNMGICDMTIYNVVCDNSCLFDELEYNSANNDFYKLNAIPTNYITT